MSMNDRAAAWLRRYVEETGEDLSKLKHLEKTLRNMASSSAS